VLYIKVVSTCAKEHIPVHAMSTAKPTSFFILIVHAIASMAAKKLVPAACVL
jgi:hypothetical protein